MEERDSGEGSLTGFSPRKVVLAVSLRGRFSMGRLGHSQLAAMASTALQDDWTRLEKGGSDGCFA